MSDTRRERQLGWITPNLQRYEAPSVEDLRDAIEKQVCPFCGAGPFTVLATHVNAMHDIDRVAFREMAGLTLDDSICDPTHASKRSAMSRVINRETLDQRTQKLSEGWSQRNAERDEAIKSLVGQGLQIAEIAERLDVAYPTVVNVIHRYELEVHRPTPGEVRACEFCGALFRVKPSAAKRYCNRTCSARAVADRLGAPAHRPGWRPPARTTEAAVKECETCGSTFTTEWPSQAKVRKYCSHECYVRSRDRSPDGTFSPARDRPNA